jgi:hypothetical protein
MKTFTMDLDQMIVVVQGVARGLGYLEGMRIGEQTAGTYRGNYDYTIESLTEAKKVLDEIMGRS